MKPSERRSMIDKHTAKRQAQRVFVRGTGVGTVIEKIGAYVLIQFSSCLAWVNTNQESVKCISI